MKNEQIYCYPNIESFIQSEQSHIDRMVKMTFSPFSHGDISEYTASSYRTIFNIYINTSYDSRSRKRNYVVFVCYS